MADAFARLRARAFAERRPLDEVAADVVARKLRLREDGGGRWLRDADLGETAVPWGSQGRWLR